MKSFEWKELPKTERIDRLKADLFAKMPEIEADRAVLLTESYRQTEGLPVIKRRSAAFKHILEHLPVVIRRGELVVGSATVAPRGCQVFPEFSYAWLESRAGYGCQRAVRIRFTYQRTNKAQVTRRFSRTGRAGPPASWRRRYMAPETLAAMKHNLFTPGNYFYNGIGHVTVDYKKVLAVGYKGIRKEAGQLRLRRYMQEMRTFQARGVFRGRELKAATRRCYYAQRYAGLAAREAERCDDAARRQELLQIAENCRAVAGKRGGVLLRGLPVVLVCADAAAG